VRCGQDWQGDILLREQQTQQTIGPVEFSGYTQGQLFRYNLLADNLGRGCAT